MESQPAPAAAVEPSVETPSESLTFDDFYRREYRHVLALAFVLTGNRLAFHRCLRLAGCVGAASDL